MPNTDDSLVFDYVKSATDRSLAALRKRAPIPIPRFDAAIKRLTASGHFEAFKLDGETPAVGKKIEAPVQKHWTDDENLAWLDSIDPKTAAGIAKTNSNLAWGKAWLEKQSAEENTPMAVAKRCEEAVEKASLAYDAHIHKHAAATQKTYHQAAADLISKGDAELERLASEALDATRKLSDEPINTAAAPYQAKVRALMDQAKAMVEKYALDHMTDKATAQSQLEAVSTEYKVLIAQAFDAQNGVSMAIAQFQAELLESKRSRAPSVNPAAQARAAKAARESATMKQLREHVAKRAELRKVTYESAMAEALANDPTAQMLYQAIADEHAVINRPYGEV